MNTCPHCTRETFRKTPELFNSCGEELAVWRCSSLDCGYSEGRATGAKAAAHLTGSFDGFKPERRP